MNQRLYRSQTDKMLGGVCGGLGEYLAIDSTIVRLFVVLFGLANGIGVLIYLVLWIVLPERGKVEELTFVSEQSRTLEGEPGSGAKPLGNRVQALGDEVREAIERPNPKAGMFIGAALVLLGFVYLLRNLDIPWLSWMDFSLLWPLLLIAAGGVLLLRYIRGG